MTARITVLGNSATETSEYETTSFLVSTESTSILVDCGPGIIRQLLKSGTRLDNIDAVVITHCHADHSGGYSYLLFLMAYELLQQERTKTLRVIALEEVHEALEQIRKLHYPRPIPNLEIEALVAKSAGTSKFDVGGVQLTTVPVEHATPNLGIRLEVEGGTAAYSSDTVYSDNFVALAGGVDVLLHEAFCAAHNDELAKRAKHSTASDAGKAAHAAQVGELHLMHPLPQYRSSPDELTWEAAEHYAGHIGVPVEFDVINLRGQE